MRVGVEFIPDAEAALTAETGRPIIAAALGDLFQIDPPLLRPNIYWPRRDFRPPQRTGECGPPAVRCAGARQMIVRDRFRTIFA